MEKKTKSVERRFAVQKKDVAKKPVKKAEPKKSADEIAFDKFLAKYDGTLAKRCGRVKLLNIYLAGIKRGKATK